MQWSWVWCCALVFAGCGRLQEANYRKPQAVAPSNVAADPVAGMPSSASVQRRVIYNAELSLVVTDFSTLESELPKLVKQHDGYLADVQVDRTQGESRSGRWQARIPIDRYDSFLDAVSGLGVPESRRQTAQDVTEEFVDLEARIANARRLEERIVELLGKSNDEIKDVIEVERELARVRGEIEQMGGRLRYLTNRTELTTVTISAREVRDYVPPEAPGFARRAGQAWGNSWLSLARLGESAAIAFVFALPWLFLLGIVLALPAWQWVRRRRQKRSAH
jgi:hypothetical protein